MAGTSPAMTSLEILPPKPFRLARQFDGLDLLELDGALVHEVIEIAIRRTGDLRTVDIDLERAAMVLLGPGRWIADALHAGRNPILLLVETLRDVLAGRAAVFDGPVERFLHVQRATNGRDVVHGTVNLAGGVGDFGDLHHAVHAGCDAAPDHNCPQRHAHAVGGVACRLGGVLIHAPDVAQELHIHTAGLAGLHHRYVV